MKLFRVPGLVHLMALLRSRILECSTEPELIKLGDERREIIEDSIEKCMFGSGICHIHANSIGPNLVTWQHLIPKKTGTWSSTTCSDGR